MDNIYKFSTKGIVSNLFIYGILHGLVDLVCAGIIYSIIRFNILDSTYFFISIVIYNILAFGLQSVFGFISDYFRSPRIIASIGVIFVIISSIIFTFYPMVAIVLVAVGNALFHVGAGSICLNLTPQKALAPGIYVAPGAIGLLGGILLGKSGNFISLPFVILLLVFLFLIYVIDKPFIDFYKKDKPANLLKYFWLIILLAFLSIVVRSFIGMSMVFPWKTDINLLIIFTLFIVLGKGIGGFLADKLGWITISVFSLLLSIPFIIYGIDIPYIAMVGIFLFNITMPITLVLISNVLPGRPGFAFGLTCLALILGAIPSFFSITLINSWLILFTIILSAISLFFGLKIYFRNTQ